VIGPYSEGVTSRPRYAIYYVPAPDGDLHRFGADLLGYDAGSGEEQPFPDGITQAVPDWHELTRDPRKYGFHATLKAPFALALGKSETELIAACEAFAGTARPIPVITPVVKAISGFVALVPAEYSAELNRLAADCVHHFDGFRAPLTAEDRARRKPSVLTAAQVDHLDRWGYPYVMDDFRFHMTLTGKLPAERRDQLVALLQHRFAALNLGAIAVDRIALFRQNGSASRFRVLTHFALRPTAGRSITAEGARA
jgi:putative phosphonate metabolism protein